jgi:hypothetical protein
MTTMRPASTKEATGPHAAGKRYRPRFTNTVFSRMGSEVA